MSVSVTIDDSGLRNAMHLYQRATGKAWPDVINRTMGNWAGQAASVTPVGNPGTLDTLKDKRGTRGARLVWPAYISKLLSKDGGGFEVVRVRKLKGAARMKAWRDPATGKWHASKKTERYRQKVGGTDGLRVTRARARQVSGKIIKRRKNTIGAIRAVIARMALEFGRPMRGWHKRTMGAARFFYTRKATPANTSAEFMFPWTDNKKRVANADKSSPQQNVAFKTQRTMTSLEAGRALVAADMTRYALDKLEQAGRRAGFATRRAL